MTIQKVHADNDTSPSAARRKALRKAEQEGHPIMTVSNSFPIETYYSAIDRLYIAFQTALDERRLDDAYVLGIRFATFSIENLPKHKLYKLKANTNARVRNACQVDEVLKKVESVTDRMDAEEVAKQRNKKKEEQQKIEEQKKIKKEQDQQQIIEKERKKYQEEEKKRQLKEKRKTARQQVEQSALSKLNAMMPRGHKTVLENKKSKPETIHKEANKSIKIQNLAKQPKDANAFLYNEPKTLTRQSVGKESNEVIAQQQEQEQVTRSNERTQNKPISTNLSLEEKRTIKFLQQTIVQQDERIHEINNVTIPAILREAKVKKDLGNRKEALYCIYLKRKWSQSVGVLKAGIFQMETQIMQLESAAEDREVLIAMKAANDTMQALRDETRINDIKNDLDQLSTGGTVECDGINLDEEDLMRELEEESFTTAISSSSVNQVLPLLPDAKDITSLPNAPSKGPRKKVQEKNTGLLKATLA